MNIDLLWICVGFFGQMLFSARFIIQWLTSEKHRKSVIPNAFWYFSIVGGIVLLAYAVYKQDPVFILGQFTGLFIYLRNLYLIQINKKGASEKASERVEGEVLSSKIIRNPEVFSAVFGGVFLLMMAFLFYHNAQWDVAVAKTFYEPGTGFKARVPFIDFMRSAVVYVSYTCVAIIFLGWMAHFFKTKTKWGFSNHAAAFLFISLVLGPGILINGVCKNGFHRARPHQTVEFGGQKEFTPAFVITNQCKKNCSFVSGDTSIMYYLFAFFLLVPGWRLAGFAISLSLGFLVGYGRMKYGAHFMSDVLFSAFLTYLTTILVYLLLGKPTLWRQKEKHK